MSTQKKPTHRQIVIQGNSMDRAGLRDGDLVTVRLTDHANHGDVVVVRLAADDSLTVKRYRQVRMRRNVSGAYLVPESTEPDHQPWRMAPGDAIVGVVPDVPALSLRGPVRQLRPLPPPRDRQQMAGLPPLAQLLGAAYECTPGAVEMGIEKFERTIGLQAGDMLLVAAGHVPPLDVLMKMATRIEQLTGKRVSRRRLHEVAGAVTGRT